MVNPLKLKIIKFGSECYGLDEENDELYILTEEGYTQNVPSELENDYKFVKARFHFIWDLAIQR